MTRHFLEVDDLSTAELLAVLNLAEAEHPHKILGGKGVALYFAKPSLRTRHSTEMAVFQLGGHPLTMGDDEVGLGTREPTADVARVLGRYHAAIAARVFGHDLLEELAANAGVPVINLLSDEAHPCQALADLLTIRQVHGRLEGLSLAYVGDFNNVARSLAIAATMVGIQVRLACPPGYAPEPADIDRMTLQGHAPTVTSHPVEAVAAADVVYTDVWTSMGQEAESAARQQAFEGFSVTADLMAAAGEKATFLHCLPAHRGEECAAEVVDGPQSQVWLQAENRMHAVRGLLLWLVQETS
ncbi:MAG: ornithine carbamoyltransferase [Acidimicrobiales bacterium]